jgi:hypothetical protein
VYPLPRDICHFISELWETYYLGKITVIYAWKIGDFVPVYFKFRIGLADCGIPIEMIFLGKDWGKMRVVILFLWEWAKGDCAEALSKMVPAFAPSLENRIVQRLFRFS